MDNHSYKIIVEPQAGGGFTAYVPKLPGCVSEGDTYDETLANIKEALQLYLEVLGTLSTNQSNLLQARGN